MAVDKLVDSTQLDANLTSVANAIRDKGGTSAQMAFPSGFVSAVQAIPTGSTPTGTKQINITQNGTTTEDVVAYANAEITVNVPSGLTLLGSGTYVKESSSAAISIPVSYTGTPKEYFYYNTTPPADTAQTIMGYNRVLDNNDLADYLPNGNLITAHRLRNANNAYIWTVSTEIITLTPTTMSCVRPGPGATHAAGTWKWFIYG